MIHLSGVPVFIILTPYLSLQLTIFGQENG